MASNEEIKAFVNSLREPQYNDFFYREVKDIIETYCVEPLERIEYLWRLEDCFTDDDINEVYLELKPRVQQMYLSMTQINWIVQYKLDNYE